MFVVVHTHTSPNFCGFIIFFFPQSNINVGVVVVGSGEKLVNPKNKMKKKTKKKNYRMDLSEEAERNLPPSLSKDISQTVEVCPFITETPPQSSSSSNSEKIKN